MSQIILKNKRQLQLMREAGKIVACVLHEMEQMVRPGLSTMDLNNRAYEIITSMGAKPSFLGYGDPPFSGTICASKNNVVVHGIPSKNVILEDGDIISVDVGAFYQGYHGDAARTFAVGNVSDEVKKLLRETEQAFWKGFEQFTLGKRLGDLQAAIDAHARLHKLGNVREFTGHGIGASLHEEPSIPNYGRAGHGPRFVEGMVLAVEPMFNLGTSHVRLADDEWSVLTSDGAYSAHYENTIAMTENGPEVFTLWEA